MLESTIKKQALLIGINQYQILPELKYARQDAEAVEQSLKQNYNYSDDEVVLLTDAKPGLLKPTNRRIIEKHLENLADQELDLFIFGFWGHGLFRNGKRYFCPLDAIAEDIEDLGLSFDSLERLLANIRAKNTCLILDCCQKIHDRGESEVLTAADQMVMENAARDIFFNRKEKMPDFQSNVAILNSCKEGQSAYEWDNRRHGIFTAHLLDAFNRRYDSVSQIVGYTSKNVEKTALELGKTQTPFYKLEGDIALPVDTTSAPIITGDVFVSYRHSSAELVAPIEEELNKRGVSYFIDRVGVNYGMDYSMAISQAVKACKVLLFVWTQDANDSIDMYREVKMALDLNKRVVPYKIGTFNAADHDVLYYQLSTLSRYEVPNQTPHTVVELVNRVEQALTDKAYQQYSFVLPEKSQDAVIQKPVIEDIDIDIAPKVIEQQQPAIQYKEITLPPLPDDLLKIQAENQGLQEAIEQLKAYTHESLAQANAALEQAQAQFDAWAERRDRMWKNLNYPVKQLLEKTISNNPNCTEKDINVRIDNLSYDQYFDFLEQIQCGKKYELAKRELERVIQERKIKCSEAIKKCQQKIEDNVAGSKKSERTFIDKVVMTILPVMPGYEDLNAPFPEALLLDPLRQLGKYKLNWRADQIFNRTRELWAENRPCIIAKREEEERIRRAEEEKARLKLEAEEKKRREEECIRKLVEKNDRLRRESIEKRELQQRKAEERARREEEEKARIIREVEERVRKEEEERARKIREVEEKKEKRWTVILTVLKFVGILSFIGVSIVIWLMLPHKDLETKFLAWFNGTVTLGMFIYAIIFSMRYDEDDERGGKTLFLLLGIASFVEYALFVWDLIFPSPSASVALQATAPPNMFLFECLMGKISTIITLGLFVLPFFMIFLGTSFIDQDKGKLIIFSFLGNLLLFVSVPWLLGFHYGIVGPCLMCVPIWGFLSTITLKYY